MYFGFGVQCGNLVQTYEPLIREELHWWEQKGITKDLLDRSTDAKVPPDTCASADTSLPLLKAVMNMSNFKRYCSMYTLQQMLLYVSCLLLFAGDNLPGQGVSEPWIGAGASHTNISLSDSARQAASQAARHGHPFEPRWLDCLCTCYVMPRPKCVLM